VALLLLALVGRPLATDDTWWHLVMGALYAGGDLWPRQDPMLHTTVLRAPVPHEWLFQVALHGLREAFGFAGLRIAHTAAVAALLLLVWRSFRSASRDVVAAALALIVLVALSWFRWMQLRPDVVSSLAMVALYVLVLRPDEGPPPKRAAAGLALMLAWANAHSLFAVGLCLALAALLGTGLHAVLCRALSEGGPRGDAANRRRGLRLALFLGLAILVTGLNPRGFAQHATFLTESRAGLIWRIQDDFLPYRPLSVPDAGPAFTPLAWALCDLLYGAFLAVALLRLLRFARRRDRASLRAFDAVHAGLGLASGAASLVAVRFHWLAFFPLLYLLRPLSSRALPRVPRLLAAAAAVLLAVVLPASAGAPAFRAEVAREEQGYWRSPWLDVRYCGPGARFLADAGLQGRLYHPFNLGGFLGWMLAPRLRTFIDGRLDHVPAEVLEDYLAIRRTSQRGPSEPLRAKLDRWGIDIFFADTFPEAWYAGRESGNHLRRLPEWMPIWIARTHAIYLRRSPHNRANLARVVRYYAERGIPFDPKRGLDPERVVREAPEWARARQLILPDEDALLALAGDPATAAPALEALAAHLYRVGRFARQVELDGVLHGLDPEARDPALRLGDGLLQLGRVRQAQRVLSQLAREHPADAEVGFLAALADAREGDAREPRGGR
jgi:hypothetical protein